MINASTYKRLTHLCVAGALGLALSLPAQAASPQSKSYDLLGMDGAKIGTATVTAAPKGVLLRVEAKGLTPGWHGMHFHEKGVCTPTEFTSAGAHIHTTTPVVHGLLNPKGNDNGDLTNLFVTADGSVKAEVFSAKVRLDGEGPQPNLLRPGGSSLVIHADPDDYMSQPIGGSGARVACAVIK